MPIEITKGKKSGAVRFIISGTEGIGKTTLCATLPDALIVDVEKGSNQVECTRTSATDWRAIESATKDLIADHRGFATVIYDSADWIERALIGFMLRQAGKKSIEDYGYGKGYTILQEHFSEFLALTDKLIEQGINVGFTAHTKISRVSPPDQTDGYDRFELKLSKQVAPLLKEWSSLYLFCNYKMQIVEGSDGRLKAQGGKERVMYANRCAAWDAKNRFGLTDELPMTVKSISHIFAGAIPRAEVEEAEAATEAALVDDPAPKHAGETAVPKYIADWLDLHSEKVAEYLVRVKWGAQGEGWRVLPAEKINSILGKIEKFARAVGVPAPAKGGEA